MAEELQKDYGDRVKVQYVDIDKVGFESYPLLPRVVQMGYAFPIIFINGEPKYAGDIMVPEIKQYIENLEKQK